MLDVFHLEADYEKSDEEWNEIKLEILGDQTLGEAQNEENAEEEEEIEEEKKVTIIQIIIS